MKYFIEISSWNLLESFVTESISPFSFYQERNFGNNLSRYLSGNNERNNHLILSTKDLGGDFSICVDETLVDKSVLEPTKLKTVFAYPKTIYYRQGLVHFRFGTNDLIDSLKAESQILLEVKCIEKYMSSFYVKKVETIERMGLLKLGNILSFNKQAYIDFDNSYNRKKGAVVGYTRGLYTSCDEPNLLLQNELRLLKNSFGGFNTQIMMSDVFEKNIEIVAQINKCRDLYFNQIEQTNSFDVLIAQFQEIENFATLRAREIQKQKTPTRNAERESLLEEKTEIENQIVEIERSYNIFNIRQELDDIKAKEKTKGQAVGKQREYFKKGTIEYERKKQLKQIIEDFEKNNLDYCELKERLSQIEQDLNVDANIFDSTLSALFTRVSDILNDLIKKSSAVTNNSVIDISNLLFDNNVVAVNNPSDNPEICYFNILLNLILQKYSETQLSEHAVLQLLVESANIFKEESLSTTEKGQKILSRLRTFWQYKNQKSEQLLFPEDDMPIFQSIFSFFVKPTSFEQIERYMLLKIFSHKAYAFMLWGAWVGFADIPKTFTNVLYQNDDVTRLIDNRLTELFV
ncbi:MAG: lantibiotic ABC transporter [Paludibacteraceae bacterium]|nr:lantibiotic ABC transporter [Paludibacteraceae bacterium]